MIKRFHFTEFLYGVVVGASFGNLSIVDGFALCNVLLAVALLVIADDWVLYHWQLPDEASPKEFAKDLFVGIAVLFVWYLMSTSGKMASMEMRLFFTFLSAFYLLTAIGEPGYDLTRGFWSQVSTAPRQLFDLGASLAIGAIAAYFWTVGRELPPMAAIAIGLALAGSRYLLWRRTILAPDAPAAEPATAGRQHA